MGSFGQVNEIMIIFMNHKLLKIGST